MGHIQTQQFTSIVSSTQMVLTLTAAIPVGHTIVGHLVNDSGVGLTALTGVSDNKGNSWSVPGAGADDEPQIHAASTVAAQMFSARVTQALAIGDTITLTLAAARGRWCVSLEVSDDIATGDRFDIKATNSPGSSTSLSVDSSPTSTTVDLVRVFAAFGVGSGRTLSTPVGWTASAQVETAAGSSDRILKTMWRDVSVEGTQAATSTITAGGASTYVAILGCYALAGASGARQVYAGTAADFTVSSVIVEDTGAVAHNVAALAAGIELAVYDVATGGAALTDILDMSNVTIPDGLLVSEADGTIPQFQGPSLYEGDLWVEDPTSGRRYRMAPAGLADRVADMEDQLAPGGNIARLDAAQTFTAAQLIEALKTFVGFTIERNEEVTSTDADILQILFLGLRSFWINEWGAVRIRLPNTHADEAALKIQRNSDDDGYIWVTGSTADINVLEYWLRCDGRLKVGVIDSPTINKSSWTAVTVDSTTVGGRYVTHAPGSGTDADGLQVQLIEGGDYARFCGRVTVASNPAAGDIIASALPILGTFNGASNVDTKPARDRLIVVGLGTPGTTGLVRVGSDGALRAHAVMTTPGYFTFDGASYRRV